MPWGYLAIGICIGILLGGAAAIYVQIRGGVRGMAETIRNYCDEMECYECEFRRADGSCELRVPSKWKMKEDEDDTEADNT